MKPLFKSKPKACKHQTTAKSFQSDPIILAIDPGFRRLGYTVLNACNFMILDWNTVDLLGNVKN